MKKFLLGLVAMGMIATSANAWWINNGKIEGINSTIYGIIITTKSSDGNYFTYSLSLDNTKEMYANALTAFSADRTVNIEVVDGEINSVNMHK